MSTNTDTTTEESVSHSRACTLCRQKKQKCSKEVPCRSCLAAGSECIYEDGQRRGASKVSFVESLIKRMDTLESLVLGQSMLLSPNLNLAKPTHAGQDDGKGVVDDVSLSERLHSVREELLRPPKRPKAEYAEQSPPSTPGADPRASGSASSVQNGAPQDLPLNFASNDPREILPPASMLQELIHIYFTRIHPWIPILHEPTYAVAMLSSDSHPPAIVLQAITAATIKFHKLDSSQQEWYRQRCHDAVVLNCMDRFSIESLQASIIIAFSTIGSGSGPRSWSIVSSATRIVEQLGLAVEEEDMANNTLLNRIGFLPPANDWTEAESLRRVFWCIFLLDRFCSVATGWNTSLTSIDIRRRLPVEGCLWRDSVKKRGRYFNIADDNIESEDDTNILGGFAYLVEASECLSRVVTLLRESVDFSTGDMLFQWFERFQTLDSMLSRWKMFLPARWQAAGIDTTGRMDENLTLAHIMHNTSVVMLHQTIAYYPDARLHRQLPSQDAAKTCVVAAGEIATIATKFIANSATIIPPAMSFCLFVAARALLAHSNHFGILIDPNFANLLQALRDASRRWRGEGAAFPCDLAGQFADRIDLALRSGSPINVRSAALQEDCTPPTPITAWPFPDMFQFSAIDMPTNLFDVDASDGFSLPNTNLETADRIFTWTDETTGVE